MDGDMLPGASKGFQDVNALVQHYIGQLCDGCGHPECHEVLCSSGRQNTAPPGKPVRKWTPRSARTIAVSMASGPCPLKHVCHYYTLTSAATHADGDAVEKATYPRDPTSLPQLLGDSKSIRTLCSAGETVKIGHTVYGAISQTLHPLSLHVTLRSASQLHDLVSNVKAADIISGAITKLLLPLPCGASSPAAEGAVSTVTNDARPSGANNTNPLTQKGGSWLQFLDYMDNESALRCLSEIARAVASRMHLEDVLEELKSSCDKPTVKHEHDGRILRLISARLPRSIPFLHMLLIWVQRLFLLHWDGISAVVAHDSVACGALLLIKMLHDADLVSNVSLAAMPVIADRLDVVEFAESWMHHGDRQGYMHLLELRFLFLTRQRALYFRTISHTKMRKAHSKAEKEIALRRRTAPQMLDDEPEGLLKHSETHYLLLNTSRGNVLRDAYDQLWQRRQGELFRPLRVRLGETDELEVGHDLGGVQIEFFNLVCMEAFAEDAQLFTTNSSTGLSYFRPGSLQPLYMFELLGLLTALALHNGITLPISLPTAFYAVLLSGRGGLSIFQNMKFEDIRDGWPVESRSLKAIANEDTLDLECSFPMEANGLRLSVHQSRYNGCLQVINATDERSRPVDLSEDIQWPGWCLQQSAREAETLSDENKANYCAKYAQWLVLDSVMPQWIAFLAGFGRVIDGRSLSLFTPTELKAFVEGSTQLDIDVLRATTRYEGYNPDSKYIQNFWRVVAAWPQAKQKQLLKFVTAVERIPIGGASNLTFVIQRAVTEDDLERLPTSSTCFGTLQLPRYPSAEILDRKLSLAIAYGLEGFGTG